MSRADYNCQNFFDTGISWPMDMYTAASLGDVAFFMKYDLGKLKDQVSVPNSSGWTPLMYACAKGHSLLVNYLIVSGVNTKCKTKSGVTPLMLAIKSGDMTTVESVITFSNIEEKDFRQWTAIFYAVHFTREKCLNYLLSRGADVNIVDFQNETPLCVAIKHGRETMVKLILQSATNLDVTSFNQESALLLANESTNLNIKTMVNERYKYLKSNENPIENAIKNVTKNVPTNSLNVNTNTPFHCSPIYLKNFKTQIKMGKSLTYSPNKLPKCSPQSPSSKPSSPWNALISKKFWSPQLRPCNDVKEFLKVLGLQKYWPIFRDEEVDFETLLTLNEENLKELGIMLFGPRKKILLAIQQLRTTY